MAHMWIRDENEWTILPLAGERYEIATVAEGGHTRSCDGGSAKLVVRSCDAGSGPEATAASAAILARSPSAESSPESWVLISLDPALRVNGRPVGSGLHALRDRDELRLPGGARLYFSTEQQVEVVPYPRADAIVCPRCKTKIDEGEAAVKCPDCAIWYHQTDDRPCYTYSPACGTCPRASDLDAGFRWTPEGL